MAAGGQSFTGQVIRGKGRGKGLGFPTANLALAGEGAGSLPKGVFVAKVQAAGSEPMWALANIGTRPTFAESGLAVELHILDFSGDLYGARLAVTLVEKLRDERAFTGPEELVAQIRNDIHQARALFDEPNTAAQQSTTEVEGVDND